jgi:hypothetical protein
VSLLQRLLEVQARKAKSDLYFLCHEILGLKEMVPHCHKQVTNALEESTLKKLITMPRGTFKSSIASVGYPIWRLIRDPNLRILLDSEVFSNSKNFLRQIRLYLQSPQLCDMFGEFFNPECWNEGEIIIKQRTVNKKEASITCSGIGAQKTGQHYDIIIADDLNSPSNSNTQEGLQKVVDHYRYYTSILDPGGTLVVIGTRYSAGDIIGFIIENEILSEADMGI